MWFEADEQNYLLPSFSTKTLPAIVPSPFPSLRHSPPIYFHFPERSGYNEPFLTLEPVSTVSMLSFDIFLPSPIPLCDIPSGCCFFTEAWAVTRSSLRMLRRVAAFCPPLRPVFLLVSFSHWRSPVTGVVLVGVVVGVGVVLRFLRPTLLRAQVTPLAAFPCACGPTLPTLHASTMCLPAMLACAPVWVARVYSALLDGCGWRALRGGVRSFVVDAGGVCTCVALWDGQGTVAVLQIHERLNAPRRPPASLSVVDAGGCGVVLGSAHPAFVKGTFPLPS